MPLPDVLGSLVLNLKDPTLRERLAIAMAYCSNCGKEIEADAKYCYACGAPTGVPPDAERGSYEVTHKRENPITGGIKMGTTGCVGCLTMVVLFLVVVALLAHH